MKKKKKGRPQDQNQKNYCRILGSSDTGILNLKECQLVAQQPVYLNRVKVRIESQRREIICF